MEGTITISLDQYEYFKELEVLETKRKELERENYKNNSLKFIYYHGFGESSVIQVLTTDIVLHHLGKQRDQLNQQNIKLRNQLNDLNRLVEYYELPFWIKLTEEKPIKPTT